MILGLAFIVSFVIIRFHSSVKEDPIPFRTTMKPYTVKGKRYLPFRKYKFVQHGIASYYGKNDSTHGNKTASGQLFNAYAYTAAHRQAVLPSYARVTNLSNGRSLVLLINDRGPYADTKHRVIDVSYIAAKDLGMERDGLARVRVEGLSPKDLKRIHIKNEMKRKAKRFKSIFIK